MRMCACICKHIQHACMDAYVYLQVYVYIHDGICTFTHLCGILLTYIHNTHHSHLSYTLAPRSKTQALKESEEQAGEMVNCAQIQQIMNYWCPDHIAACNKASATLQPRTYRETRWPASLS